MLAPVLFATMQPAQAALISALLGLVQSGLLVARNRREVLRIDLRSLIAFAAPGLAAGVFVFLRIAPSSVLRVLVGVSAIVATIVRRMLSPGRPMSDLAGAPAGFLAGLLTTSATVNGPPLVLFLSGRGATHAQMRGTLAAMFIVLDTLTMFALAVGGALVLPPLAAVVALAISFPALTGPGFRPGRPHARARPRRSVTVLLLALGIASIVAGITS